MLVAGESANGHPLWKQMGGKFWLYSGAEQRSSRADLFPGVVVKESSGALTRGVLGVRRSSDGRRGGH